MSDEPGGVAAEQSESPAALEGQRERTDVSRVPAWGCFVALELAAGAAFLVWGRRLWFRNDDWDFLVARRAGSLHDLFAPHTGHWVTLPILAYRVWWSIFGLRDFVAYQVLSVGLHLVAAYLLRRVMRRSGVRPWLATLVAGWFVCLGAGYENIIRPFQITLVGSLVFGLVYLLIVDHDGPLDRRDVLGMAFGLAGLMCSSVGVVMVIAVAGVLASRRGVFVAIAHVLPLALIYALWWLAIGHTQSLGSPGVGEALRFARRMLAAAMTAAGQAPGLGAVLVVTLVIGFVIAARRAGSGELRSTQAAPLSLVGTALVFAALTAMTRGGTYQPNKSRYLYIVVALALPALGLAIDAITRAQRWLVVPTSAILLVSAVGNVRVLVDYTKTPAVKQEAAFRRMVLAAPLTDVAKQVPRKSRLQPVQPGTPSTGSGRITIGWLLDNLASHHLPTLNRVGPADLAMDTIRLSLAENGPALAHKRCRSVGVAGVLVHARQRTVVVIRVPGSVPARILPADDPADDTLPLLVPARYTARYTVIEPIDVRVVPTEDAPRRTQILLCSTPAVIRGARFPDRVTPVNEHEGATLSDKPVLPETRPMKAL